MHTESGTTQASATGARSSRETEATGDTDAGAPSENGEREEAGATVGGRPGGEATVANRTVATTGGTSKGRAGRTTARTTGASVHGARTSRTIEAAGGTIAGAPAEAETTGASVHGARTSRTIEAAGGTIAGAPAEAETKDAAGGIHNGKDPGGTSGGALHASTTEGATGRATAGATRDSEGTEAKDGNDSSGATPDRPKWRGMINAMAVAGVAQWLRMEMCGHRDKASASHSRYVDPDAGRMRDVNDLVARTIIMSTGRR